MVQSNELRELLEEMVQLRKDVYQEGRETFTRWQPKIKEPSFLESAKNLAFYLAVRRRDIRELQESLMKWGLSSLGRLESRTMDNLDAVIASLCKINDDSELQYEYPTHDSFLHGRRQLDQNAEKILGTNPANRYSRIMVTLPTEAGENEKFVFDLISAGMDVARINCAHDDPEIWKKMIEHIRKAEKELHRKCKILMDIAGPKIRIKRLVTTLMNPKVNVDDRLFLTRKELMQSDHGIEIVLECSIPEIISCLNEGEPILIDDGKIEGEVETITDDGVIVRIKKLKAEKGVKIKAEKGLNFPRSNFRIDLLTEKDKKDLDFVCDYADIIGFSFVKSAEDITFVQDEIRKRLSEERASKIPLIVKMETIKGVKNLPEIIVAAAGQNPLCVMIARGDLAVEAGYLRMAELQEEILWICEAADVPVVWATQVLEGMLKTGIPARAEITDVAEGARAECVMLNKGRHILEGMNVLDQILEKIQEHQYKKMSRLRPLNIAKEQGYSIK
ncbi:pyruvate kinase [Sporolactobacillus putidus]|uniref:Pyruvate kinase n=1 Tax=Sporolactobacillus putidus TaxID=492735 RepID=A0A917S6P6_9BACL|nr:pyruvate kinase [Sporolactobacillus putidus]GGL57458.1 pyruvate kinase [Sporolactobacillus putidus]